MSSPESLLSVELDLRSTASKSCQSKHVVVGKIIQLYLDELQESLGLPGIGFKDMTARGGLESSANDEDISKWWMLFWERQPNYWIGLKQANDKQYADGTLVRYMGAVWVQLKDRFLLSRFFPHDRANLQASNQKPTQTAKGTTKEDAYNCQKQGIHSTRH